MIILVGGILGLILFILLIKRPELSLAIQFCGSFIYLYIVFKAGFEPNRLLTGGFYGFLAVPYLVGGILFVVARPQKLRLSRIDRLFFYFFFWVFLNYVLFSTGNDLAYVKLGYAPLLIIAPYWGILFLSSTQRIKKFLNYCILVITSLIIPAFYELIFNQSFSGSVRFSMYHFEQAGDNPIQFGITFSILLIILFVLSLEQKKLAFKHLVLIIPSTFLLFRSGSRGAVVCIFITMLFYFFVVGRLSVKTYAYAIIIIAALLIGAYKFNPSDTTEFYQYTFTQEAQSDEVSSVYQRIILWKAAVNDFRENPIFGVGLGNSGDGHGCPHNILLEIAAEFGVVGLFMFLSMCYLTIKKAIRCIKRKNEQDLTPLMKVSLSLFIYFLLEAMVSGYITSQTQLFISMGLIASLAKLQTNNQRLYLG